MKKSQKYIDAHKCRIRGYTVVTVGEAEKACVIEAEENVSIALKAFCEVCNVGEKSCDHRKETCEKLNDYKQKINEKIQSE